jgi:hypothetical protein
VHAFKMAIADWHIGGFSVFSRGVVISCVAEAAHVQANSLFLAFRQVLLRRGGWPQGAFESRMAAFSEQCGEALRYPRYPVAIERLARGNHVKVIGAPSLFWASSRYALRAMLGRADAPGVPGVKNRAAMSVLPLTVNASSTQDLHSTTGCWLAFLATL